MSIQPRPLKESVRLSLVAGKRGRLTSLGLLLVGALLLSGCGNSIQHRLEGRWLGQSVENFDLGDVAVATGWARGLSLEFSGSHLTVAIPAEDPRTGKYRVTSEHANDVELAVTRQDGSVDTANLKLDDERSLRFMVGDNRSVVLHREQ